MIDTGSPGCDESVAGGTDCGENVQTRSGGTTYSEMAHLFYVTLGNKAYCTPGDATCVGPQPGWGLTNTATFQNMTDDYYWSGLEYALNPSDAWGFRGLDGGHGNYFKTDKFYALAVRTGDVTAVPEPQTYALLMLGLIGLAVARRRPH
ncbi:MAG: PEP-CTERM sorting domain-containing protein [Bacteriovorax sp.]|nr:PEP-CTERM sorting domain-containing protein [Rhizobacter sp.]